MRQNKKQSDWTQKKGARARCKNMIPNKQQIVGVHFCELECHLAVMAPEVPVIPQPFGRGMPKAVARVGFGSPNRPR